MIFVILGIYNGNQFKTSKSNIQDWILKKKPIIEVMKKTSSVDFLSRIM